MDPYNIIAVLALLGLLFAPQLNLPGQQSLKSSLVGSILLAIVWPILFTMVVYYLIKKYLLRLGGPSDRYFEAEALVFVVTAIPIVVWFKLPELLQ